MLLGSNNVTMYVILYLFILQRVLAEETAHYVINSKKCLNIVSDKFLSFSVDPAVILGSLNVSLTTIQLAQHLSPAFIQIAGQSTNLLKFVMTNNEEKNVRDKSNFIVNSAMWESLNEWLMIANLTPVFAVSDSNKVKQDWNPKDILPLLNLSDKLDLMCYWQLGDNFSNTSETQHQDDLVTFRRILDAFPAKRDNWKIVASLNKCPNYKFNDGFKNIANALFLKENCEENNLARFKIPIWTLAPKSKHSITFLSGLHWAKNIGNAAKNGFNVIFKQLILDELSNETPVYWISLLHKSLMGRNVLDIKGFDSNKNMGVYAHCTKNQNSFSKQGAMTVLIVNMEDRANKISIKIGGKNKKQIEVRSYILTSPYDESAETYLNNEKLSMENLDDGRVQFIPKIRRARVFKYLTLLAPPKSAAFFVLPGARIPVCVNKEDETTQLVQEIYEDQTINFSPQNLPNMIVRDGQTLDKKHQLNDDELKSREKRVLRKVFRSSNDAEKVSKSRNLSAIKLRQFIRERARILDKQNRKQIDSKQMQNILPLLDIKQTESSSSQNIRHKNLRNVELTSQELLNILSSRIKSKADEKNIHFTNNELNELLKIATKQNSNELRLRRDINMDLLRLKTNEKHRKLKSTTKSKIKQSSSEEFVDNFETSLEKQLDNMDSTEPIRTIIPRYETNLRKPHPLKINSFNRKSHQNYNMDSTETVKTIPRYETNLRKTHPSRINSLNRKSYQNYEDPENYLKEAILKLLNEGYEIVSSPKAENYQSIFEMKPRTALVSDNFRNGEFYIVPKQNHYENNEESRILNLQNYFNEERIVEEVEDDGINYSVNKDYTNFDSNETPLRFKRNLNSVSVEHPYYVKEKLYKPSKFKYDYNKINNKKQKSVKKMLFMNKKIEEKLKHKKPKSLITTSFDKNSIHKVRKRSNGKEINPISNAIDNFLNEIPKDTKFGRIGLDKERGDYKIIFPNKDRIEIVEDHGDTDVKFVHHTTEKLSTCNIVPIKNITKNKLHDEPKKDKVKGLKYIEKITHKHMLTVLDKVFVTCADFMNSMRNKLASYINYIK